MSIYTWRYTDFPSMSDIIYYAEASKHAPDVQTPGREKTPICGECRSLWGACTPLTDAAVSGGL